MILKLPSLGNLKNKIEAMRRFMNFPKYLIDKYIDLLKLRKISKSDLEAKRFAGKNKSWEILVIPSF